MSGVSWGHHIAAFERRVEPLVFCETNFEIFGPHELFSTQERCKEFSRERGRGGPLHRLYRRGIVRWCGRTDRRRRV